MKTIKTNAISAIIFTLLMFGATNLPAQAQSINKRQPTRLTSTVLRGTVSGNKVYYYSMRAKPSSVVTVRMKAVWTNGVSTSLNFMGMDGSDGGRKRCCKGGSYMFLDHGSFGTKVMETSFTVISGDEFLMGFAFSTRYLSYIIEFDGILIDDEDEDDPDESDAEIITVPGRSGNNWINTGIRVRRGDVVFLNANGTVDVSAGWGVHTASGTRRYAPGRLYPVNSLRRYGLAAKVVPYNNTSEQKWGYGDSRQMYITKNGTLWLTVNDDAPDDNSGEFEVRVTVSRTR